jgi:hypothetical protein
MNLIQINSVNIKTILYVRVFKGTKYTTSIWHISPMAFLVGLPCIEASSQTKDTSEGQQLTETDGIWILTNETPLCPGHMSRQRREVAH